MWKENIPGVGSGFGRNPETKQDDLGSILHVMSYQQTWPKAPVKGKYQSYSSYNWPEGKEQKVCVFVLLSVRLSKIKFLLHKVRQQLVHKIIQLINILENIYGIIQHILTYGIKGENSSYGQLSIDSVV